MKYLSVFLILFSLSLNTSFRSKIISESHKNYHCALSKLYSTQTNIDSITEIKKSGVPHSEESKAKISAANKGKVPWNQGKQHSEETRKRIAEKTKEAALQKKIALATEMGMTLEQYEEMKKEAKKKAKNPTNSTKGGLTEEGRKRLSESLKQRWQSEEYRKMYTASVKRNVTAETREKISQAIKLKWQDNVYRNKCQSQNVTMEQRQKISQTLKKRWSEDPEFKLRMLNNLSHQRTPEWKATISEKIKEKWNDPNYRQKVITSNRSRYYDENGILIGIKRNTTRNSSSTSSSSSSTPRTRSRSTMNSSAGPGRAIQKANRELYLAQKKAEKEAYKLEVYRMAKIEVIKSGITQSKSVKQMLGDEFWLEEKLKRSRPGFRVIDDVSLELAIVTEWLKEGLNPPSPSPSADRNVLTDQSVDTLNLSDMELPNTISNESELLKHGSSPLDQLSIHPNKLTHDQNITMSTKRSDALTSSSSSKSTASIKATTTSNTKQGSTSATTTTATSAAVSGKGAKTTLYNIEEDEEGYYEEDEDGDDEDIIEFVGARGSSLTTLDYDRLIQESK